MKTKNKILSKTLIGLSLLSVVACGGSGGGSKGSSSGDGSRTQSETIQSEHDADGMYYATLETMNNGVGGAISGNLSITKEGPRFIAYLRFNGGTPQVVHQQRIYVGTSCPSKNEDANGDGYVDIVEALDHVGKILIPLDSDISSQERGSTIWPMGDIYGYYHWERATAYERIISDLRQNDLSAQSDYAKLGPDGALNLQGRVVIVQGTGEISNLPDTVATKGRLRNFQTIPVACGVIKKVKDTPGEYSDDPSLGPVLEDTVAGGAAGENDGSVIPVNGHYRPTPTEPPSSETNGTDTGTTNTGNTGTGTNTGTGSGTSTNETGSEDTNSSSGDFGSN